MWIIAINLFYLGSLVISTKGKRMKRRYDSEVLPPSAMMFGDGKPMKRRYDSEDLPPSALMFGDGKPIKRRYDSEALPPSALLFGDGKAMKKRYDSEALPPSAMLFADGKAMKKRYDSEALPPSAMLFADGKAMKKRYDSEALPPSAMLFADGYDVKKQYGSDSMLHRDGHHMKKEYNPDTTLYKNAKEASSRLPGNEQSRHPFRGGRKDSRKPTYSRGYKRGDYTQQFLPPHWDAPPQRFAFIPPVGRDVPVVNDASDEPGVLQFWSGISNSNAYIPPIGRDTPTSQEKTPKDICKHRDEPNHFWIELLVYLAKPSDSERVQSNTVDAQMDIPKNRRRIAKTR